VILAVLVTGVLSFTVGVSVLVQRIFDNFGPAIQKDLDWKTVRGAQELAGAADLGLALSDAEIVAQAFGEYRKVDDVVAIVAVNAAGKVITSHGSPPEPLDALLGGPAATVRHTRDYLVAWAGVIIEGNAVGKVALVVSTRRLVQSQALLRRISLATIAAGLLSLLCAVLFVNFFTRSIVERDAQLAAYAFSLEQKVAERTAELDQMNQDMRLVLDNVEQGFITVGLDGIMSSQRSTIVDRWFGVPAAATNFADYLRPTDAVTADWFEVGLTALVEDILPREMLVDQLPQRMRRADRTLRLSYTPILAASPAGAIARLLVVITDITDEIARDRIERDSREMMRIFQRAGSDKAGTQQFFAEAQDLVQKLVARGATPDVDRRLVHTLKGNCAMFGIDSLFQLCHEVETRLQEEGGFARDGERQSIRDQWDHVFNLAREMVGERRSTIELEEIDLQELSQVVAARAPHEEIAAIVEGWRQEPVALRFARLADRAGYLARRLGKPTVTVHTETSGVRLDAARWSPFWSALVHAINNAIDHGIEDAATRVAQQKPAAGRLWLSARRDAGDLVISLRDDGRGVDWRRLSAKAAAKGLPHATQQELVSAMLTDGVTTRDEVTSTSGRGIGLTALHEMTAALGGNIEFSSEPRAGTTLTFRFREALCRVAGDVNKATAAHAAVA
jgi:HPt (histidine-containing phosphotransfer) domain-containing protein/two-component sensor histidine kinase